MTYITLFSVLFSSIAKAAEWAFQPALSGKIEFNDNLTLTTLPHGSVWGLWAIPSANLSYATETMTLSVRPIVEFIKYLGKKEDEQSLTNIIAPISAQYLGERTRLGLNVSIKRDNALLSELQDTGVVNAFRTRNLRSGQIGWDRLLTERLTLQTSYEFTDVEYDKGLRFGLIDFQSHTGTIGGTYQATEETDVFGTLHYQNFHAQDIGFRSQSGGIETGITYRFTETFSGDLSGGVRLVSSLDRTESSPSRSNDLVWLFSSSLTKQWERLRIIGNYSRTINPSGRGVLLETDRVALNLNHKTTETLNISLEGILLLNDSLGSSRGSNRITNTRYWQIGPSLSWRATENFVVKLSYAHAQRNSSGSDSGTASSNAVSFMLTYDWVKWAVSR